MITGGHEAVMVTLGDICFVPVALVPISISWLDQLGPSGVAHTIHREQVDHSDQKEDHHVRSRRVIKALAYTIFGYPAYRLPQPSHRNHRL